MVTCKSGNSEKRGKKKLKTLRYVFQCPCDELMSTVHAEQLVTH